MKGLYTLKQYLKAYGESIGKPLPKDYKTRLRNYIQLTNQKNIIFSSILVLMDDDIINASAGLLSSIVCNDRWAANIIFNDSAETRNAFLMTVGHELGHKQGRDMYPLLYIHSNDRKFVMWVNEVHADFFGVQSLGKGRRTSGTKAMRYKLNLKNKSGIRDKEKPSHPSWERRIFYMESYDFTAELIKKISLDTGCRKQKLIDKACSRFEEIRLI